ncbi:MAG: AmmeMemoRadiSam system protein A [Acidobacteriota bacterium]|nr:AmmeMemoRadiSam system protein A [Acidobacteriota bacterium]
MQLAPESRAILLRVARQAIESAVTRRPLDSLPERPEIAKPQGAFVTLTRQGNLRGCIGKIEPTDPLVRVVAYCAVAAATEDPRFHPVLAPEIPELEIELSILSPPSPVRFEQIEIGRHGLIATRGNRRGLLLPQVADERNWPVERFLEETCIKAGLDPYAWKQADTRIEAFTAEVFGERDLAGLLSGGAAGV